MRWQWSQKSRDILDGLDGRMVSVCDLALSISKIDFALVEGLRTPYRSPPVSLRPF